MQLKPWSATLLAIGGVVIGFLVGRQIRSGSTSAPFAPVQPHYAGLDSTPPITPLASTKPTSPQLRLSPNSLFGPPPDNPEPKPIQPAPLLQPAQAPPPSDPLQFYSYTGNASFDDNTFATVIDSRTTLEATYNLGDQLEGYTITSIDHDSISLRKGTKNRRLTLVDQFNPIPMIKSAPKEVLPNPGNLASYRNKTYQSFYFQVTGAASGSIWGSAGTYTDDSALATAAVHAGVLKDGEAGVVHVTVLPGYDHYSGDTSNGVTSNAYAEWQGSYRVDR